MSLTFIYKNYLSFLIRKEGEGEREWSRSERGKNRKGIFRRKNFTFSSSQEFNWTWFKEERRKRNLANSWNFSVFLFFDCPELSIVTHPSIRARRLLKMSKSNRMRKHTIEAVREKDVFLLVSSSNYFFALGLFRDHKIYRIWRVVKLFL